LWAGAHGRAAPGTRTAPGRPPATPGEGPGTRERLSGLADSGQPLIVDLNRVTFIDSTGLGVLVAAARRAAAHGGSLHAVCSRPQTRKLLWLTGVDRRIPLTATVDGALMLLAPSRDAPG
jgi:anti-anti-sigma factor